VWRNSLRQFRTLCSRMYPQKHLVQEFLARFVGRASLRGYGAVCYLEMPQSAAMPFSAVSLLNNEARANHAPPAVKRISW
jgi:hypothetical protein